MSEVSSFGFGSRKWLCSIISVGVELACQSRYMDLSILSESIVRGQVQTLSGSLGSLPDSSCTCVIGALKQERCISFPPVDFILGARLHFHFKIYGFIRIEFWTLNSLMSTSWGCVDELLSAYYCKLCVRYRTGKVVLLTPVVVLKPALVKLGFLLSGWSPVLMNNLQTNEFQSFFQSIKQSMESVTIDFILSKHRSCLHTFDFIRGSYSGAAYCSVCQFANSYLRNRRYCYSLDAPILSLRSFCERFTIPIQNIDRRFADFIAPHDSLSSFERFHFPSDHDVSHIHGVVCKEPSHDNLRHSSSNVVKHTAGDWCLSPSVRCSRGRKMEIAGVVLTISEGSPSTSYATTCTHCKATVWHAGLGGQLILFDLMHYMKIDWDYPREKFGISFIDGRYFQEISTYTALNIWLIAEWAFTESAAEVFRNNPEMKETQRPDVCLKLVNACRKVEPGIIKIVTKNDAYGNFMCDGQQPHRWRIVYPAIQLDLIFPPEVNFLVDHLMYPRLVGRAREGHSCRAYGMWGIPDYAPRFNQNYYESVKKRNEKGLAISEIVGVDRFVLSEYNDNFSSEDEYEYRSSSRGYAEMDPVVLETGHTLYYDDEEQDFYFIQGSESVWLKEATKEDLDMLYGEDVDEPVEGEAPPAVTEEEAVLVEDDPTAARVDFAEDVDVHSLSHDSDQSIELRTSMVSSIGSVLVDFTQTTKGLGKVAIAPLSAMTRSVQNFGLWLEGNEKQLRNYKAGDFPMWVNGDFKNIVGRLGAELSKNSDILLQAISGLDDFREEVLLQFKRIRKMLKMMSKAIDKVNRSELNDDISEALTRHGDRLNLVEEQISVFIERARDEDMERKVDGLVRKIDALVISAQEIPVLKRSFDQYKLLAAAQMKALKREIGERDGPVEGNIEDCEVSPGADESPMSGPALRKPPKKKSITRARGIGQMETMKPEIQTDKPDSVLPVNPDMIYEASASKAGDHIAGASPDLANMPSSRYLIGNFRWGVVDNEHTVIQTLTFPECIFNSCPWLKNTSQMFQYFRTNGMELIVTMTSNFTQGGVLFVGWDSISSCRRRKVITIYELFNLPHGLMVAGKDAELKFHVGFDSIQERLSLAGYEVGLLGLGSLCFSPLNGLVCPSQTTQYCEMNVYCKLEDPDFIFRTVIHDYTPKFDLNSLAQVLVDPGDKVDRRAVVQGLDMCGKSLIYTGKWASTDQNRLLSLAVHPCSIKKIGKFLYPSSLSMISSLYHYWSGSLRYTFIFGGNQLTTGKLHVCAIPGQFITDAPNSNIIMGTGGRVMNLKDGDTHFEFEVPFHGTGGKQRICRHTLFDAMYYGEDLVTRLHVWVVDPLITNIGATSSLSFAVTVEPGADFKLYDPRGIQPGITRSIQAQGPVSQSINTKLVRLPGAAYSLFSSWGHIMYGKFRPTKGLRFKVAPMYREQQVDMNILSWISNYYARWRGTLEYKFVCKPHRKNLHKFVYFWHMYEDPHMEAEYGYEGAYLPPSGVPSLKWDLSASSEFVLTVPFQSRFNSLYLPLSQLTDVKYHPTHYYNGVVHASYYGTEDVNFNVYIRALNDFELFGHGAMTVIAQEGGDVSLPYLTDLTSVEDTPVSRKNEPLQIVRDMFEDYDPEEDDLLDESEDEGLGGNSPTSVLPKGPSTSKAPEPIKQQSARGKGQMEDGVIGRWAAKKLLGESTAENLAKIDSEKVAKMVNWGCEASKFDFEALSGLVHKLVPLAETLNKRAEEAKVFTDEGAKSLSFLGELAEMGGKLLEMIKSVYKSSTLGWIAAQYDDGKLTLAVVGTIALFIVGVYWWRNQNGMTWYTKVASIIAILWAPELGAKSMDLYTWIVKKMEGVTPVEKEKEQVQTCHKAANSSFNPTISARGVAQMELDFLDGMFDYSETILASIMMIGSLFCLSIMPNDKTIGSWTKSLTGLGDKARAFTSIGSLLNMLKGWAKTISDNFMGWMVKLRGQKLVGDDAQLSALMKFGVAEWVKRVSDLCLEEEKLRDVNSEKKLMEIRSLYDKGQLIKEAMLTHNFGAGTAAVFRDTINKVEKLINETYSSKGLGEPRIDPIHVAFIGKPGVGKSAVVQTFVKGLLDYLKYPMKDRIYSRSCADAFWSRYCRQPVVLYDDLGALTGDSSFSDYGEFINLKANVPYPLNMAAVEEKGAMFQSHFIVSTSNAFFLDNNSNVRNPEAFYRRRDLAVCIERDENVPMNPTDPSDGLLFTVVDTFTGQPRSTWPHWFGIDDGQLALVRVPYRQFMVFTLKYTKGYLKNQQALLKTFKANYLGEEADSELEIERILADLVAQRSGSDISSPAEVSSEDDPDFWEPRAVNVPDQVPAPFPGAAALFANPVVDRGQRGRGRQRNPRDIARPFEGQMDTYVRDESGVFYTSLELLGLYTKWEITGENLAQSLQTRFGRHIDELYRMKSTKLLDHVSVLCTCKRGTPPLECNGILLWEDLKMYNALYVHDPAGVKRVWLTAQVHGLNAKYRVNFVPSEPWMIFCGIIQAMVLYTHHWGCPGQVFSSIDLMKTIEDSGDEEDEYMDSYEMFPVSVYQKMQMEDGVYYYDRDDFKGSYPIVCGVFGGIPLKIGGHHFFLGKKENRREGEVTDEEYKWVRKELVKKSCSKVLESLLPAFSDMDIILMKQVVAGFTGYIDTLSDGRAQPLGFVADRLGWDTYGVILFYMLLVCKEGINHRLFKKKKRAHEENEKIAEGLQVIKKEEMTLLSGCSGWLRKALVFGGLLGASVAAGLTIWGIWKGISGFFGFVWGAFTPSDKSEEPKKSPIDVPKIEAQPVIAQPTIPVATVIEARYVGQNVEVQAGTNGASGDQRTRYSRNVRARQLQKRNTPMRKWKGEMGVSDLGVVEDSLGRIDAVDSDAMAHLKVSLGDENGLKVSVPDHIMEQVNLKSRLLENNEIWQERMLGLNRVQQPKFMRIDGVVAENGEKAIIVKGNTPFVVERNIDPTWTGVFLDGRDKSMEKKKDKAFLESLRQPNSEITPLMRLEATIGDEKERITIQAEGGGHIHQSLMEVFNVYEDALVQVIGTESKVRFFGVMIVGAWMLIPAHFLMKTVPGEELVHLSVRGIERMRLDKDKCFLVSKYQDLALVDLGPRCPLFRDLRAHFVSNTELMNWKRSPGVIMNVSYRKKGGKVTFQYTPSIDMIDAHTEATTTVYDAMGAGDHVNVAGFKYPAITALGWCGSLLVSAEKGATRRILGIHTAGHTEYAIGYAEMVTVESLNAVLTNPDFAIHAGIGEGQMGKILCKDKPRTTRRSERLKEIGVAKPNLVPSNPAKTDIIKSPIHGLFGKVATEPSILSPYDYRLKAKFQMDGIDKHGQLDPLLDAVEKYGEKTHSFPIRKIKMVERFLKHHYGRLDNSLKRRDKMTEDESINGVQFNDSYLPLNMDTSPGWPSVLRRPRGEYGKKFLFEEIPQERNGAKRYRLRDKEVRDAMILKESAAMQGKHDFMLTVECSKDERRKKKKIYEEVATRSFTNLDVAQNLLYRKYFLNFGVMVQENFQRSFCKVGINPNGPEWSELIQGWLEKSPRGFAGDYAKFDGIGDPEIFMSICRVVNEWYNDGEENARVREFLLYDAFHRFSLVRNVVVEINQGMPSGFPMTVIFNSIVNFYYLCMAWCDILQETEFARYATPEAFWELCGLATYGDDNVVAVPPQLLEHYNLKSVARWLKVFGISYTDDQKRPIEESEEWVPIQTVTFLKRGIKELVAPMLIVAAPLEKVSIEEQGHWIRSGAESDEYAMRQNLANALYEASLHGKDYFDDLKGRLDTALDLVHLKPTETTYYQCQQRFWSYHFRDAISMTDLSSIIDKDLFSSREKWSSLEFNLNQEAVSLETLYERSKQLKDEFFDLQF